MRDDLLTWCRIREEIDWAGAAGPPPGPVQGRTDGLAEYAADRAGGLPAALRRARADLAGPLTYGRLAGWQAEVLGVRAVGFRTGPAYAKGGRDRYGLHPDTPDRFRRCLAEADDRRMPVTARAARVYLDIAFFHPFPDGNGRAALLALDFVLRRYGIALDLVAPLCVVRRPDDPDGALDLVRLIDALIRGARRRGSMIGH